MKKLSLFALSLAFLVYACDHEPHSQRNDSPAIAAEPAAYSMPRTEVIPLRDSQSGGQYELYVKLPESYEEDSESRHPVIYFTDAVWHIDILSAATEYILEEAILVGISWQKDANEALVQEHGIHVSRFWDYTVMESSNPEVQAKYQLGQAGNHLDFIRDDVINYVEAHYRTIPESRTYFGYSAGGLFGAYIVLTRPETFKNYILGSPSLDGDIPGLKELDSSLTSKLNANLFISYGSLEEELGGFADEFIGLLKNRNDESLALHQELIEGSHSTAFPMTGVRSVTWLAGLLKE